MTDSSASSPKGLLRTHWNPVIKFVTEITAIFALLGVIWSVYQYVSESTSRRREAIFAAWSIVTGSETHASDGGRAEAIRHLIELKQDVSGMVLDGALLSGVDFKEKSIEKLSLKGARLRGCSFYRSKLFAPDLSGAAFKDCNFSHAQIFSGQFASANFADQVLEEAVFDKSTASQETSFNGAHLSRSTFSNSPLDGVIFDSATLRDVRFINMVSLRRARFVSSEMPRCYFSHADASDALFTHATMTGCVLRGGTSARLATFDRAKLGGAVFDGVDLSGASFFATDLSGATFSNCNLNGTKFESANLKDVRFLNNQGIPVWGARLAAAS